MDIDSTENDILTLPEVAQFLKVAEKTVLRMVHRGEIPCMKIASQWRFMRSVLDDWLLSKMQVVPRNDLSKIIETDSTVMPLSRLTEERLILPNIQKGSKEAVLKQLTAPLRVNNLLENDQHFLRLLLQREEMASTAIGKGVAIPHVRNPEAVSTSTPLLVIGACREGTDFSSPDGLPVHLFFLLYTDSVAVHLRTISKITRIAGNDDFRTEALKADGSTSIMNLLIRFETKL